MATENHVRMILPRTEVVTKSSTGVTMDGQSIRSVSFKDNKRVRSLRRYMFFVNL